MGIVRTDIPMSYALFEQTVEALVARYPFLRTEVLATTAFGRNVRTLTFGGGARRVIFSAAHHANEWITTPLILKFIEELSQTLAQEGEIYGIPARLFDETATIYTVPMVDPDGVALVTGALDENSDEYALARRIAADFPDIPFPNGWKANGVGVDLNLQYPALWLRAREIKFMQGFTRPAPRDYVGRAPLTQPESRALAEFTQEIDPALVLAYHTQGRVIYWQFQDYAVAGARALADEFSRLSGYALEETPIESSYAGYKDWFIQNFRRPGFTIEVGEGENPLPLSQFDTIYRDNLGILTTAALGLS